VTGLKGTYGRIPRAAGRSRTQRIVSGVIGAGLSDVVLATSLASGPDRADPDSLPGWPVPDSTRRRLRVGYSADLGYAHPDPAVAGIVLGRITDLATTDAITLVDVSVRLADPKESWLALADLEDGRIPGPARLERAYQLRRRNDEALAKIFGQVDVLVTPTTPHTAFPIADYRTAMPAGHLCWAFNLSGHPAVTVPAGLLAGLPVGLQAIAAHHCDDLAIAVAGLAQVPLPDPPHFWPRTAFPG
jgi:amidase